MRPPNGAVGRPKPKPYVDFEVGGRKNILWKIPLPGLTQSQPIVVGDRVIQTCEPRTILCLDLRSGKEIWRRELDPFAMIGVTGKDREEACCWRAPPGSSMPSARTSWATTPGSAMTRRRKRKKWAATLARIGPSSRGQAGPTRTWSRHPWPMSPRRRESWRIPGGRRQGKRTQSQGHPQGSGRRHGP